MFKTMNASRTTSPSHPASLFSISICFCLMLKLSSRWAIWSECCWWTSERWWLKSLTAAKKLKSKFVKILSSYQAWQAWMWSSDETSESFSDCGERDLCRRFKHLKILPILWPQLLFKIWKAKRTFFGLSCYLRYERLHAHSLASVVI